MAFKYYSISDALKKVQQYCAYQERCHLEVKNKLLEFGLTTNEINNVIVNLIEDNYLNEERFAQHFARGKFRMKQWGRVKIGYELRQKQISTTLIKKALQQIDLDEYMLTLLKLYSIYFEKQKGILQVKKIKTQKYLQQKGFEITLINEISKTFSLQKQ
ncbi:MAG: regulatory protein RecX [Chitinophagaceae bacterium]